MKKRSLGIFLLLAAVGAGCYANALGNGFVFDDQAYLASPLIQRFQPLAVFGENWLKLDIYRPLALLSLAFDFQLYQMEPTGYHLSNLLLHILNSLLFYRLACRLIGHWGAALAGALFYVAHPLQTEVVAWVSARGDLLAGLFFLAGFLCHLRGEESPGMWRWRLLAWICFAGSLLAKETGIVLPAALWWRDISAQDAVKGPRWLAIFSLQWFRRQFGYALVLGLVLGWRWLGVGAGLGEGGPASANFLAAASLLQRFLTVPAIFLRYMFLVVFPWHLSADYSYASIPLVETPFDMWFLGGVGAALALIYLLGRLRSRPVTFVGGFFWLTLLPVSNLFFLAPCGMAERYLYLTLIPISLGTGLAVSAWLGCSLAARWPYAGVGLIALLLVGAGARTIRRNQDWQSDYTLFSEVLRIFPNNARAHENLGYACVQRNELTQAIEHYKTAIAIRPERARTHATLGVLYSRLPRPEEAARAFKTALHLNPQQVEAHFGLALLYQKEGRYLEAIDHYEEILRLAPDHRSAAFNLAQAYQEEGRFQEAVRQYERVIRLDPAAVKAYYYLGELAFRQGRYRQMAGAWERLLQLEPGHPEAGRIRGLLDEYRTREAGDGAE